MSNEVKVDLKNTRIYDRNRDSKAKVVVNRGGCRAGKCLAKGTEVVMFDGSIKKVETVKLGDKVMGIDSFPRTVLELHQGIGNLYLISQNKGIDYVVEEDHLLALKEKYGKNSKKIRYLNISIKDYLQKSNKFFRRSFGYKNQQSIEFGVEYIPKVEPYLLGLWIADGRKDRFCFSVNYKDTEIKDSIYDSVSGKYRVSIGNIQNQSSDLSLVGDGHKNDYIEVLKELGIYNNKHIPLSLRRMSVKNRLEFLAGYIDGDGYLLKGNTICYSTCSNNFAIIEGIKFIAHSLGFSAKYKYRERFDKRTQKNYKSHELIIGGDIERIPVRLSRKKIEGKSRKHAWNISSIKVTPYNVGEYYGFSLDGDGLFLLKDFTVVHNSFAIEQLLLLNRFLTEENKQILVVRKTLPSLRQTGHKVWKDWLVNFELSGIIKEEKQHLNYYYNGNYLHFSGLDNPGKARSTEWNYVWMQEATDFTYDDYKTIKLRLSAPSKDGKRNQLFMCFNPIDEYHWIKTQVIDKGVDEFEEIHSTYKDNPFLTEDYIRSEILSLKEIDINYYNIFALGEWGRMSSLIFSNWCLTDEFPEDIDINNSSYGLDFGFNHPTALCENRIKDDKLFVREHIYEDGLTNSDLIKKLHQIIPIDKKSICIYADSAEPARIEEIAREGFKIEAAEKEVLNEIDFLKRRKIHIEKNSINIQKEIKGYSWRVDKNKRVLDEPVKYKDDLMSAMRYGVYGKFKNRYGSARIRWI